MPAGQPATAEQMQLKNVSASNCTYITSLHPNRLPERQQLLFDVACPDPPCCPQAGKLFGKLTKMAAKNLSSKDEARPGFPGFESGSDACK